MPEKLDMPVPTETGAAEFDAYAENYEAGMDNPVCRLAGKSADDFIELKVHWLLRDCAANPAFQKESARPAQFLDYGCGAGTFLRLLQRLEFPAVLHGCDLSSKMLAEARRTWENADVPDFQTLHGNKLPYPDTSFDAVIMCALLHHVPPEERAQVIKEGMRVLRPNGRLYIFEHNPWNPVTAYVVRHAAVDRNAILLNVNESRGLLRSAGASRLRTSHIMFFPPRWRWVRGIERCLSWLPLGGQYVVTGDKP